MNHRPEKNPRVQIRRRRRAQLPDAATDQYDVIVGEPSNPWITGVSNLFTREYWQLARARLADDGIFCQWAQLYEMAPWNIKTILRRSPRCSPTSTSSRPRISRRTSSSSPPTIRSRSTSRRCRTASPTRRLRRELKRGGVESADDVLAYLLLTPDELPAFTAGSPLNTDDNALIEFAAPRDLLGLTRTADPYLAKVYGTEWPYGRFDRYLVGLGAGDERWKTELRLARSLLAHGKRSAADRFLAAARRHGAPPGTRVQRLTELLAERDTDDREIPLADAAGDPTGLEALDPPRLPEKVLGDYLVVERAVRARAWAHALMAMRKWPERYIQEGGLDLQLLTGYLMYKADLDDVACDRLKPLVDDAAYAARRPATLYYLGRAEYGAGLFAASVRNMDRYLDATERAATSALAPAPAPPPPGP